MNNKLFFKDPNINKEKCNEIVTTFCEYFSPLEDHIFVLMVCFTEAIFCECHISAETII